MPCGLIFEHPLGVGEPTSDILPPHPKSQRMAAGLGLSELLTFLPLLLTFNT